MLKFWIWATTGEGAKIRALLGHEPHVPNAWYTPEWLLHMCGNAMLIGFYVPAIALITHLATR